MPPPVGELQRRLREYKDPRWGYRKGEDGEVEKDLFDGELPKGWLDSPAAVRIAARSEGLKPPYAQYGIPALSLELKRRTGKGARPGTPAVEMVAALDALDAEGST